MFIRVTLISHILKDDREYRRFRILQPTSIVNIQKGIDSFSCYSPWICRRSICFRKKLLTKSACLYVFDDLFSFPCFFRLHSLPFHPSQRDIVKRNPHKKEWWIGAGPSGPFIYTPFTKGGTSGTSKQEINWIVGEPVQVMIELANPCSFDLVVESIYLSVHSGNFDAFPVTVNLPPNTSKLVLLSGIPTQVGQVSIPGCIVHSFGVITEHLFKEVDSLLLGAAQGLVLSDRSLW